MTGITFTLDDAELQAWCAQTPRKLKATVRSAVDKSARAARAATIPVMAKDSGVPVARFRPAVPLVRGATAANLTATWTVGKSGNFIRSAMGGVITAKRGEGVEGATFVTTGGGSAHLSLPKAFSLGGKGVFVRKGPGKKNFKPIYAAMPNTMLGQEDGAALKKWREVGTDSLTVLVGTAVQVAFDGGTDVPTPAKFAGSTS